MASQIPLRAQAGIKESKMLAQKIKTRYNNHKWNVWVDLTTNSFGVL